MRYIQITLAFISAFYVISATNSNAEMKTLVKEYTYQASDNDSKATSRAIALATVKKLLLEEFGTYIEGETEVSDGILSKDQVSAAMAGFVKTEILEEKWDGIQYHLKAKLSADPEEVANSVKQFIKDKKNGIKRSTKSKAEGQAEIYSEAKANFSCGKLTVKDTTTGLIWLKNGNLTGKYMNWYESQRFIEKLNSDKFGGYNDWRQPTAEELEALIENAVKAGYGNEKKVYDKLSAEQQKEFYPKKAKYLKGTYVFDYFNNNCFEKISNSLYFSSTKDDYNDNAFIAISMIDAKKTSWSSSNGGQILPVRGN